MTHIKLKLTDQDTRDAANAYLASSIGRLKKPMVLSRLSLLMSLLWEYKF
jgi:hypothetical protein